MVTNDSDAGRWELVGGIVVVAVVAERMGLLAFVGDGAGMD